MARPRSEAARQKVIEATQTLVAEHGMDGATVDAIAKRSGVAKTTIYRHFRTGNELLVHALDCQVERIPAPDTGSLEGDLVAMFTMLSHIAGDPGMRQMVLDMLSAASKDPDLAAVQEAMVAERKRPLEEIVLRAVDRGEIPPIPIDDAVIFIEGPFAARIMMRNEPLEPADIPRTVRMLARGLGATPTDG